MAFAVVVGPRLGLLFANPDVPLYQIKAELPQAVHIQKIEGTLHRNIIELTAQLELSVNGELIHRDDLGSTLFAIYEADPFAFGTLYIDQGVEMNVVNSIIDACMSSHIRRVFFCAKPKREEAN